MPAGVGFRVKSGWATAIVLGGPTSAPILQECRVVLLSDPTVPESKQPCHAALRLPEKEGRRVVERLRKVVERAAAHSVDELLEQSKNAGHGVRAAALVVGSLADPASLHNDHIRAHALEGQMFRTALEDALRAQRISCAVFVEKNAYGSAAAALARSEKEVKRLVANLGESHDGPWRAEEKLAALAAWVALAKSS